MIMYQKAPINIRCRWIWLSNHFATIVVPFSKRMQLDITGPIIPVVHFLRLSLLLCSCLFYINIIGHATFLAQIGHEAYCVYISCIVLFYITKMAGPVTHFCNGSSTFFSDASWMQLLIRQYWTLFKLVSQWYGTTHESAGETLAPQLGHVAFSSRSSDRPGRRPGSGELGSFCKKVLHI
jgi:hypothetical protein